MTDRPWTTEDSRELYLCSERQVRNLDSSEWARGVRMERLNQDQIELFNVSEEGELILQLSDYVSPPRAISLQKIMEQTAQSLATIRFPELIERQMNRLNLAFSTSIFWESEPEAKIPANFLSYQGIYPLKVNNRREVLETIVGYQTLNRFPITVEQARLSPLGRHAELMETATRPHHNGLRHISPIWGLECGSRAELVVALAYLDKQRERLSQLPGVWEAEHTLVLNGPKDHLYVKTALEAMRRKLNVILVVDSPIELVRVLELGSKVWADGSFDGLQLGVRIKTMTRGSGIWEESGGKDSKFGLCGVELYEFFNKLIELGLTDALRVLHFHVGSQLVEWESITDCTIEAARLYLELKEKGFGKLNRIDLGGGLAVNYDQHLMKAQSSALYDHEDYADMVVRAVSQVLAQNVKDPTDYEKYGPLILSSESGRFLTSSYTILAAQVLENRTYHYPAPPDFESSNVRSLYDVWSADSVHQSVTFDHQDLKAAPLGIFKDKDVELSTGTMSTPAKPVLDSVLWNLHRLLRRFGLFAPAILENRFDLKHWKKDTQEFFDLSYLEILSQTISEVERYVSRIGKHSIMSLRDRIEYEFLIGGLDRLITTAFRHFCQQNGEIVPPEGFPYHPYIPSRRYIVNFSIFSQLIDTQLVSQYFPVIPLSHLDKKPDYMASIGDLTCDSGGEIKKFVSFVDRNWGLLPSEISASESVERCFTKKDHKVMAIPGERLDLKGVPVHDFDAKNNERYYIAWLLVGAYQDVLSTRHNMFGVANAIYVSTRDFPWIVSPSVDFDDPEFMIYLEEGETVRHVITDLAYNTVDIQERLKRLFRGEERLITELFRQLPYSSDRTM